MSGWPSDMSWWRERKVDQMVERDYPEDAGLVAAFREHSAEAVVIAEESFAAQAEAIHGKPGECEACVDEDGWDLEEIFRGARVWGMSSGPKQGGGA